MRRTKSVTSNGANTTAIMSRDRHEAILWKPREACILTFISACYRAFYIYFLSLTGNLHAAQRMLWADMAFNRKDKYGRSLPEALAKQCRMPCYSMNEQEHTMMCEAAESLWSIHSERLDSYTVIERKDERTMTLRHRDGHVLRDVRFPAYTPVAESFRHTCLVAQLVTWSGRSFVNGPTRWISEERKAYWNGDKIWSGITEKEREAARRTCFTTPSGKRISLYEDLYTVPEDPTEARYTDQGICMNVCMHG